MDSVVLYSCNPLFMRKILFSLLASSTLIGTTFAATISCPSGSGCDQCFGFTLENSNTTYDVFIPRPGENELINLSSSSIFAETFQWADVTPVGNITSSFTLNPGPNSSSWTWATMKGDLIKKWTIPSSINYSNPVYRVKYTTNSYTLDANSQKKSGSDSTHAECAYFYASAPQNSSSAIDWQCSNIDTYYTSNPRNSSLSDEDLCDVGTASSVTYSTARERWTYTCSGRNGGTSDSCIVDLEQQNNDTECSIEVTDRAGMVPFSTSILCSGNVDGTPAIVISKNGKILEAFDSDSESYDFDDSGLFTISCYPDVLNDKTNVCKTTVSVSGDCGNGSEESDEQCDDGNSLSGDGCSRACQLEVEGGPICGNSQKESWEQCDDGNNDNGDTCTNLCQNKTPDTGPVTALLAILLLSLWGAGYSFYRKWKNIA